MTFFHFPNHTLKLKAPDQPQSTGEESPHMILIVTCAMLCVSFSSKSKTINVFPKHILKSKAHEQSNQAIKKLLRGSKELFVFVKVFDQN